MMCELQEELLHENQQWYGKGHVKRCRSCCLLHNQLSDFVAVLRPNTTEYLTAPQRARRAIKVGIMPALTEVFGILPRQFPYSFRFWIREASEVLELRFARDHDRN